MSFRLEIRGLCKSFASPGGAPRTILDVPEFSLAAGQQVALRGESGSGKTTFLHCIAGLLAADAGSIHLGETNMAALAEPKRDRLRAQLIGYVFQTFNLLQGCTCEENVRLGLAFGGERSAADPAARTAELLARVGLTEHARHFPRQLSTGQQQRIAIARALANRPQLVLADEPTGNLDRRRAHEALMLIREVCREAGAALLLVSHDEAVLAEFEDVRDFRALNRTAEGAKT